MQLWELGVEAYDVLNRETFVLKGALVSTITDFPEYSNLLGWKTKGTLHIHIVMLIRAPFIYREVEKCVIWVIDAFYLGSKLVDQMSLMLVF